MIECRAGIGYDVHRLTAGAGVTLCGVMIPCPYQLVGHSDADIALHAVTDALLGTIGAGDIGDHFPPTNPQWKDASSSVFVEHAVALVSEAGGRIVNTDVALIAEVPRIKPHRAAMRERLAELLGVTADRVGVKATTNEKMGFVGRKEGLAAFATCSVAFPYREPTS